MRFIYCKQKGGIMKVSSNGRTLIKDDNHFFYLADTCWSAFTNIEEGEWDQYLSKRKAQGFNTLQINIMPQWDASEALNERTPFVYDESGNVDFTKLDDTYFEHAREMCIKAREDGFELSLVALWCNYIPGTWANAFPKNRVTFPISFLEKYSEYIVKYFGDLVSLFMISGDTDFNETSAEFYINMSKLLRSELPDVLQTMHIKGRYDYIPVEIDDLIDIYFYQSGHNNSDRKIPFKLAESFYNRSNIKPIINSEPCYEQMGFSRRQYGRWSQLDVRRAAWESVLSGAAAGITYGAAGIYSWHRDSSGFMEDLGEGFDTPQSWSNALNFPGAEDYGRLKRILEVFEIENIVPYQRLLESDKEGVRVGRSENYLLVYMPYNTQLELNKEFKIESKGSLVFDLSNSDTKPLNIFETNNKIFINQHNYLNDVLILIKIKEKI